MKRSRLKKYRLWVWWFGDVARAVAHMDALRAAARFRRVMCIAALALLFALPARAEWSEPPAGTPADVWNGVRPVAMWVKHAILDRSIDLWGGITLRYQVRPAVPGGIVPVVGRG